MHELEEKIPDLNAAFLRICDMFNADEYQRNWFIYLEEDKNRIIIERVIGDKAKLTFLNDQDVKEEPIFDQALDPQPETFADDSVWSPEFGNSGKRQRWSELPLPHLSLSSPPLPQQSVDRRDPIVFQTLDSGGESLVADNEDSDSASNVPGSNGPTTSRRETDHSLETHPEPLDVQSISTMKRPKTRSATNKDARFDLVSGAYVCRICGKSLSSPKLAQRHVNSKHKDPLSGTANNKTPKTKSSSSSSLSSSLSSTLASDKTFVCPLCEKTFKNGSALKRHLKSTHASEVKEWSEDEPSETSSAIEKTSTSNENGGTKTTTLDEPTGDGIVSLAKVSLGGEIGDVEDEDEENGDDDDDDRDESYNDEDDMEEEREEDDLEEFDDVLDENSGTLVPSENTSKKFGNKLACMFCDKKLSCSRALKRHVATRHLGQRQTYACPECEKVFQCQSKMREHILKDHPQSEHAIKRFPCLVCSKEFLTRLKMKEHMNKDHTTETKTCSVCNKSFKQVYSLEYHMDIVHTDLPNPFADGESHLCDNCGASFSTKGSLNLHRYTRHVEAGKHDERKMRRRKQTAEKKKQGLGKSNKPKEKREFVCRICGKVFTSHNCMLKQHIAIVHEGKRYPCEICGAEFTTPDKKRVHIGNIHKGIKHKCEYCGRDFTLKDTLKTHINAVHKKIKHRCDICAQEFSIIQDMRQHIKAVHHGIKSKCEFCGKDFNRPQEMKRHQRKVHQDHLMGVAGGPRIEMVGSKIELVEVPAKIEIPAQVQAITILQQPQQQQQTPQQHIQQQLHSQQQQHQTLVTQPLQHHHLHHLQPQIMTAEQVAQLTQHVILTTTADGQTITQTITSL